MAMISKDIIDKIKQENDIVDVIGEVISLESKGKNQFGLCPFHDDHHSSLCVSSDKQIYTCFSCKKTGNVISFVKDYYGYSFIDAIKFLANRVGMKVSGLDQVKQTKKNDVIYDINQTVNTYFKNNLLSEDGKKALEYLNDRGIDKQIITTFNIGLATNNKLSTILSKKYKESDLIESDIVKEYNNKLVDTFTNRIIFPILSEDSSVLGFSGRIYLKGDENSKYYNTSETRVFKKSNIFYNLNNAIESIKKKKEIIITEGFMDTIRMHSIGYTNTVALMGTSFTSDHLEKIKKLKCSVVLNLDQDSAGVIGTISAGETLLKNNINVSVIVFDGCKDSDEYIKSKGKESFDISYNNKIPFIDFKLNYLKKDKNMKDTNEISNYINEAIDSINEIEDDILRELKINSLAKEFNIDSLIIKNKIKNKDKPEKEKVIEEKNIKYNKYDISELRLLYLMMNFDDVISYFENGLGYLIKDSRSSLAYKIIEFKNDYGYFNLSDFFDYISENEKLNDVVREAMKFSSEEYSEEEVEDYINTIKEYSVKRRIESLKKEMNETLDVNKKIELASKIESIKKEVLKW